MYHALAISEWKAEAYFSHLTDTLEGVSPTHLLNYDSTDEPR